MTDGFWPEVTLRDVCSALQYGYTASASMEADGPRFLRITDIVPGYIEWAAVPRCEISRADHCKFRLQDGDIVVARTGATVGYAKLIRDPPDAVFASYLVRFRVKPGADARFVGSIVESAVYKAWVKGQAGGAAQPNANAQVLAAFSFRLPPLDVQRRIASIVGAYDDLIEVNRRRITLLEEMARRLFEEWFVHFRFPGHESVPLMPSGETTLPQGWRAEPLAAVAAVNADTIKPASAPARIGYIDISSVSVGTVEMVEWMPFADAPGRARRRVKDGSTIWSMVRPNRRSYALLLDPERDTVASTGFAVLDAQAVPFAYLFQAVTTDAFVGYLSGNATGAAYPAVTGAVFERASIVVPPDDLATRYAAAAEPMLRLASKLHGANVRLAASRNLLLPRLISGELPVAAAERELEAAA